MLQMVNKIVLYAKEKVKFGLLKVKKVFQKNVQFARGPNILMTIWLDVPIVMVQIRFMMLMMEEDFQKNVNYAIKKDI